MATAHAWKACRSNPTQVRVLSPPQNIFYGTYMPKIPTIFPTETQIDRVGKMEQMRILYTGVFVTGFCVMVLELLGTRVVAPYIGSSLYVWTSLIGVIMAFLSLGYYWGGLLSEKKANISLLSLLVLATAAWVFVITLVKEVFMLWLVQVLIFPYWQSIVAAIVLFGVPSFLLGAVSPYAARLAISSVNNSGASVGKLYAISTAGSIAGTFLTGFLFVPMFGHIKTMYMIVSALILVSILFSRKIFWIKILFFSVSLIAVVQTWTIVNSKAQMFVLDKDTAYVRAQIAEFRNGKETIRGMFTDSAYSSSIVMGDPTRLVFDYYRYYDLMFWNSNAKNVLMIGGAGMGYPRYALRRYPAMHMTVVEIDPELYSIAKSSMGFEPTPNLSMVFEDGRVFLNKDTHRYDAILFDVFSAYTMPWYLSTYEAAMRTKNLLSQDGVVIINSIGALDGKNSYVVKSLVSTYKRVFGNVEVFATKSNADFRVIQNIVIVASTKPLDFQKNKLTPHGKDLLSHRSSISFKGPVLTDDWAPIDSYTSTMLVNR